MNRENTNLEPTGTLGRLREEERERRKELILQAAEELFASEPFDRVSMREIARRAGISASSIYTYYPNQESLFIESAVRNSVSLIERIEAVIETKKGGALEDVIHIFLDFLVQREAYFQMMTQFMIHGDLQDESTERLNHTMRRLFQALDSMFETMGFARKTRLVTHYFFSNLNGILITFRRYPGRSEAESVARMKKLGRVLAGVITCLDEDSLP
jgi:AcrR family transcriptional regulator